MASNVTDEDVTTYMSEQGGARGRRGRRMRVKSLQPICIPVEVPEHDVVTKTYPEFKKGDQMWSSSAVSNTPGSSILSVNTSGLWSGNLDSTTASSVYSGSGAESVTSSDMYGWEETLSRKPSFEQRLSTVPTQTSDSENTKVLQYSRANGTKKGLLYRVLGPR